MELKLTTKRLYYICLSVWSFLFAVCGCTRIESIGKISVGAIYNVIWFAIFLCLLYLTFKYRLGKELFLSLCVIILGIWSGYNSGYIGYMFPAICFVTAGRNIDTEKAVKCIYQAQVISFILIVFLALTGIIENYTTLREGTGILRYSFGYYHPNTLATEILQICLLHWYIHRHNSKFKHIIFYIIATIFVFISTNSMTSTALLILQVCFSTYLLIVKRGRVTEKTTKKMKWLLALPLLFSIYTAVYGNNFRGNNQYSTLIFRFESMQQYWKVYGLTLGGQQLMLSYSNTGYLFTLDNSYIFLLLGFGLLLSIVFVYEYMKVFRFLVTSKDMVAILIIFIFAILGLTEASLMRFGLNFTLIFWLDVFGKKYKKL